MIAMPLIRPMAARIGGRKKPLSAAILSARIVARTTAMAAIAAKSFTPMMPSQSKLNHDWAGFLDPGGGVTGGGVNGGRGGGGGCTGGALALAPLAAPIPGGVGCVDGALAATAPAALVPGAAASPEAAG